MKNQPETQSSSSESQQLQISQKAKKNFYLSQVFSSVYMLVRLSLAIITASFIISSQISEITTTQGYLRMQENMVLWQKDMIIDMIAIYSYTCPEGYEPYSSYTWPGNREGCYCQSDFGTWDFPYLLDGQCTYLSQGLGCKRVEANSPLTFSFWKKDRLICLKRLHNFNFATTVQTGPSKQCASSFEYQFEMLEGIDCPITNISSTSELTYSVSSIDFSFSRENEYPIADIKISQYSFCEDYNTLNLSPDRGENYPLELQERTYCDTVDQRVIQLDTIDESTLFTNNPRISQKIQKLPLYPEPSAGYTYKLGMVRYPPWSYSCRTSGTYSISEGLSRFELEEFINDYTSSKYAASFFIIVFGVIFTVGLMARKITELRKKHRLGLLYCSDRQIEQIKPQIQMRKNACFEYCLFCFMLITGLCAVVILAVQYVSFQEMYHWYKNSGDCTKDYMLTWIEDYKQYFVNLQKSWLLSVILLVNMLVFDVLFFIWRVQRDDLEKEKIHSIFSDDENEEERSNHPEQTGNGNSEVNDTEENMMPNDKQPNQNILFEISDVPQNNRMKRSKIKDMSEIGSVDYYL